MLFANLIQFRENRVFFSFRPKIAGKLVEQIAAEDLDPSLETYMTDVFEHYGIEMEDLAPRTYLLHPSHTHNEAFPSIPDEGVAVTFDRKRALSAGFSDYITKPIQIDPFFDILQKRMPSIPIANSRRSTA